MTVASPPELSPERTERVGRGGRAWGVGASVRRPYAACLAAVLVAHTLLFGWLLVATDFLPYVYDNNETFSSLWHAHNLYHFDFSSSWGLTDEAFSPHPAAHPYVHTHQGNFPRLFAFVLYALGARTADAQIALTTFTAGVAAITIAFVFLARLAGPGFALIAALVLMTDYLFYAQWHVVTYRVWHLFFVFSTLLCARGIGGPRPRLWAGLTFLNYAALFYYELIFVAFVSLLAGAYTAWLHWRRPLTVLRAWVVQGLGGLVALAVLGVQLTLHLGVDVVAEDFYLTFLARNAAAEDPAFAERVHRFFQEHNIVFWYNVVDVSGLRSAGALVEKVYAHHLEAYTPFFVLLVGVLLAGTSLGLAAGPWAPAGMRAPDGAPAGAWAGRLAGRAAALGRRLGGGADCPPFWAHALGVSALAPAAWLILVGLFATGTPWGVPAGEPTPEGQAIALLATAGLAVGALVLGRPRAGGPRGGRPPRLGLAGAGRAALLLYGVAAYLATHAELYRPSFAPLWHDRLTAWMPAPVSGVAFLAALGLALALAVLGARRVVGAGGARGLARVVVYLVLGSAALAVAYLLSPGYVLSGYLYRAAPLTVFLIDVAIAAAIYVAGVAARRAWSARMMARPGRRGAARAALPLRVGLAAAPAVLVAIVAGYWLYVQWAYVGLLPPNHFAFLKMLASPPFAGASFVVNTYGAPPAAYTGQWAYIDTGLERGDVRLTEAGYDMGQDLGRYLWMADKRENPEYRRPDYFLCMRMQGLGDALWRARGLVGVENSCANAGIVRRAEQALQPFVRYEVVAQDPSPWGDWAIVALDWDVPPYLAPLDAAGRSLIRVRAERGGPAGRLSVAYRYRHQEGVPEGGTIVRLYGASEAGQALTLLREVRGTDAVAVPADAPRVLQVSVTPATATKLGPEYFAAPMLRDGQAARGWLPGLAARLLAPARPTTPSGSAGAPPADAGPPADPEPGAVVFDAATGAVVRVLPDGLATPLVLPEGQTLRLADAGAWDAARRAHLGMDLVLRDGRWTADVDQLDPLNPNARLDAEPGAPLAGFSIADAATGRPIEPDAFGVERAADGSGEFVRVTLRRDLPTFAVTDRVPAARLADGPVVAYASVRVNGLGTPTLALIDVVRDGRRLPFVEARGTVTAAWQGLVVPASGAELAAPEATVSLVVTGARAGDTIDLRVVGIAAASLPAVALEPVRPDRP